MTPRCAIAMAALTATVLVVAAGARAQEVGSASRPAPASAASASATAPANIEDHAVFKPSATGQRPANPDIDWSRMALALAAVVGLIFATRWLLKRAPGGARPASGVIEVLARTQLPPRHQLVLVRLGERLVLMGSGPEGLSALSEVSEPAEVARLLGKLGTAGAAVLKDMQLSSPPSPLNETTERIRSRLKELS